jgi:hypothetical protein
MERTESYRTVRIRNVPDRRKKDNRGIHYNGVVS